MKLQLSLLLLVGGAPLFAAHAQDAQPDLAPETEQVAPAATPYEKALDSAFELGQKGKWDEARLELDGALKLAQTPADKAYVYGQMGATYEAQNNHAQSQVQFRRAMMVPDVAADQKMIAHFALATSLRDGKNYVEAGKEIDAIMADVKYDLGLTEYMVALSIRGDAQMAAKDWEGARQTFDELTQLPINEADLKPVAVYGRASAQLNRGRAYMEEKKPAKARELFVALQKDLATLPKGEAMTVFFGWVVQKSIAQSYLDEKNNAGARVELEKLLAMPQLPAEIAAQAKEDLAALKTPAAGK